MDESSESIMDYLRSPSCTLTKLLLNGAGEIFLTIFSLYFNLDYRILFCDGFTIHFMHLSFVHIFFDICHNFLRLFKDVDDGEACNLAEAFRENKSVKTLGLASNQIGAYENLKAAQPNFKTGGEGLAEMLLINTTITELDLSWNSIRLESAVALGTESVS